ncbi:HEAT repeat domain-containing protein [Corallococcus sp. EGB]|uniref:HEAT repeat domain-containing protein n=1 Tax=Corallococcus sp. EGB TaxID=1521117 RepID=UPI001CBD5441|nr:HEAT repeat domain-containing protein [Corallococcus sp. EGB]
MWSSRESIAAQLVALLKEAPQESVDLRFRGLSLLDIFGGEEQLPFLRELIFAPLEPYRIRVNALRVAARFGLTLSGQQFVQLYEGPVREEALAPSLDELFDYARLESFDDVMKEALLRLSPRERSRLLCSPRRVPQPPALDAWFFEHWYQSDRHLLLEECNVTVAFIQRGRPEAWRLLCEWSEGLSDARMEHLLVRLKGRNREEVARLANGSKSFHDFAARRLLLSLNALLAHWGEEELLRRLDRVVQAENVACTVPHQLVAHPTFFARAVELLGEWEVARRRVLYRRICDFDMAAGVRLHLYEQLREKDPAAAARWGLAAWRHPGNADLLRQILEGVIARAPVTEDRPVLLAALREPDEAVQLPALSALLSLGESGPGWMDRLHSLSHAESPRVRVLALAGLVQQGQREGLESLRRMAIAEPDKRVRSAALGWLGVLDSEDSRPLFVNALAQADRDAFNALSRRGEDEDLSLLLEVRLNGSFSQGVDNHFRHHLARREGRPVADGPPRDTSDGWCEACLMYE